MTAVPEPFTIAVPDSVLEDLHQRLDRTRWPLDPGNDDWRYGTNRAWLQDLVAYWRDGFDWRAQEAEMNRFEHFRVVLDDVPIHFLRRQGQGPAPVPIILTHGWPWTFWDFAGVIDALADPAAHGGDWGASVTAQLGHEFPEHLIGVHLSLPVLLRVSYYSGLSADDYAPEEAGWFEKMQTRMATAASHVAVHTADPQTLAYALNDSPVGLAAWILERRRAWSDHTGDVYDALSRDFLLTNVTLYWVTESIGSTMRYYWENWRQSVRVVHDRIPAIEAPTGMAVFPNDLVFVPRRLAEEYTNLVHWTVMPRGGHFSAAEEPDLIVEDLRAMFRALR